MKTELTAILGALPEVTTSAAERSPAARWAIWLGRPPRAPLPPLRLSWSIVQRFFRHGVLPLYTPLSGSWLNMAESVQRILVRRALVGQHPQSAAELIQWVEDTVAGWNQAPTSFVWNGRRRERHVRARQRHLGGSCARFADHQLDHQLIAA